MMRIITWILGFAIVFFVAYLLFFGPGKTFLTEFFTKLPSQTQEQSETNFDILISNIKKCQAVKDDNCLCEGFSDWPASFPLNSKITLTEQDKKMEINWSYKNKVYKTEVIDNLRISVMFPDTKDKPYSSKKEIDFKKIPELAQEELKVRFKRGLRAHYPLIISGMFYKESDTIYLLVSYKDPFTFEQTIKSMKKCGASS